MGRVGPATALVAILVVVAGCLGTEAADSSDATLPPTLDARQGGGSILGLVVDDESFPLEGVLVQIGLKADVTSALSLRTDRSGFFDAKGLAARVYLVLPTLGG